MCHLVKLVTLEYSKQSANIIQIQWGGGVGFQWFPYNILQLIVIYYLYESLSFPLI